MDLYVKEMPKSCWECKLMYGRDEVGSGGDDEPCCTYTGSYLSSGYATCPLKPIPKCECEAYKNTHLYSNEEYEELNRKCNQAYGAYNEIYKKLAVTERALELMLKVANFTRSLAEMRVTLTGEKFKERINIINDCQYNFISVIKQQATAELKAEKGEGNG